MAQRVGDTVLTVQVTAEDIAAHQNKNPYQTSLSVACNRQIDGTAGLSGVGYGDIHINLGGAISYDMDAQSAVFANIEITGASVTIPYTATLTIATII